jgi:CheY-like chemotaxis protein
MPGQEHLVQIVDDDHASRRALKVILEADGFVVLTSHTCMAAEREAALRPPDLLIVTMGVSGRYGLGLIKAIRAWSLMPIVVLSARRDRQPCGPQGTQDPRNETGESCGYRGNNETKDCRDRVACRLDGNAASHSGRR